MPDEEGFVAPVVVHGATMEILLVATELSPWIQSTEAADEVSALARTFKQLGHDVTVLAPFDEAFEGGGMLAARRLTSLPLRDGRVATIHDAQLSSGAKLVLLGLPSGSDKRLSPALDPDETSISAALTFAHAVTVFVGQRVDLAQAYDVVHLFDWTTALVGLELRQSLTSEMPKIVLSVHDARRSGSIARELAAGMASELLNHEILRADAQISLLKAGLLSADAVVVPSESHADSWSEADSESGLGATFAKIRSVTSPVPGGVDYARVNPATNPCLPSRFDAEDASAKQVTKTAVLRELGLPLEPRPFVLVPGPLTPDAGGDLVVAAIESLLDRALSLCIWTAPSDPPDLIAELHQRIQGRVGVVCRVPTGDDELHRGFAAADFALYPARRTQGQVRFLAAQRYGAIVVGFNAPGLREAVVDCDVGLDSGTGFLFDEPSSQGLIGAVTRAQAAYFHPAFARLRRRVMRQDWSWERPSRRLLQIYRRATTGKLRESPSEVLA